MSYWDNACAFFFPDGTRSTVQERIQHNQYSLDKFKECVHCNFFSTYREAYKCSHPDGRNCLLQIGNVNYSKKETK
jgi:hypothetical protein